MSKAVVCRNLMVRVQAPAFYWALLLAALFLPGCSSESLPQSALEPVRAEQWVATGMGPLTGFLFEGVDDTWSGSLYQNYYTAENRSAEHAVRYYTRRDAGSGAGTRSVAVDVAVAEGSSGRAGLIFGLDRQRNVYHLFVRESDGAFTAYRRHEAGIDHLVAVVLPDGGADFHRLEVREAGEDVELWANGERVAKLSGAGVSQGEIGIVAFGLGTFGYTNYAELADNGWRG